MEDRGGIYDFDNGYLKIANEQNLYCKYSKVENAAGRVCIFIRKNFPIKIVNSWHDNISNWVGVEIELTCTHLLHIWPQL